MPIPKGTQAEKCSMQRALFREDPDYAKSWIKEHGDQCKGVKMATTRKIAMNSRNKRGR